MSALERLILIGSIVAAVLAFVVFALICDALAVITPATAAPAVTRLSVPAPSCAPYAATQRLTGEEPGIPTDAPGELGRAARYWLRWQNAWDRVLDRLAAMRFAMHPGQKTSWSPAFRMPEFETAGPEVYYEIAAELKVLIKKARARCDRLLWRMEHPRGSGAARWLPLLRWAGWPTSQLPTCVRVIWRESNGKARKITGRYCGLFQLDRDFGRHVRDICRPLTNVRLALQLYHRRGWQPWASTAY